MDPNGAFLDFCYYQWNTFDINRDGRISFDEFVQLYNTILDR